MRVVVVGGTGNISRGVVKSLLAHGHEVTIFNRGQSDGPVPRGVRVMRGDRKDFAAFEAAMQGERFDAAIDMICYTREEAESDVRAFGGVRHFIHTSTVAVFGGPLRETPTNEESPRNPVIPYGRAKVETDEVFRASGLPYTIFMPAQTWSYQPRLLRQLGLTSHWIDRVRRGMPILVSHDGQLVWGECHADDAGVAYGASLGRERCLGPSYILTRPGYRTWRDYHDAVAEALGKRATYVDVPAELAIAAWPEGVPARLGVALEPDLRPVEGRTRHPRVPADDLAGGGGRADDPGARRARLDPGRARGAARRPDHRRAGAPARRAGQAG